MDGWMYDLWLDGYWGRWVDGLILDGWMDGWVDFRWRDG